MTRVLVLTTEPLPFEGMETTGAGLRAWGLAKGLESSSLEVIPAMPFNAFREKNVTDKNFSEDKNVFHRNRLTEFVNSVSPDVIVFQHWGMMRELEDVDIPIALDLHGPHLLERYYWERARAKNKDNAALLNAQYEKNLAEKLRAFRRADFIVCAGKFQRRYFLPFLLMAGHNITDDTLPVVPFSLDPGVPEVNSENRDPERFVYGGMFLPWQNPENPIQWTLESFDETEKGKLNFYGGAHPVEDVSGGRFQKLVKTLEQHARVNIRGIVPSKTLEKEYLQSSVALDLMGQNPERELAFTSRTVFYLWCGLPVLYNNYSEISELIAEYNAGWTFSPEDEAGFKQTVRNILNGKENLEEKRKNTARLIREKLNWNTAIKPLAEFCHDPYKRKQKTTVITPIEKRANRIATLEQTLSQKQSELLTIRGKKAYKIAKKLSPLRWIGGIIIFLLSVPVSILFLLITLLSDRIQKCNR